MAKLKPERKENSFGVAALVIGIVGLVFMPVILGILAVIFGAIGMNKEQKYAKAGFILGIIDIVWFFIAMLLFGMAFLSIFA